MRQLTALIFLMMSIFLSSCGGQKSSQATLVVSQSMMLSNSGFPGGLMIQGSGPGGAKFSKFINHSSTNSSRNQLQILLPPGDWTFRAVGWNGNGSGGPLQGKASCGQTNSVLSGASATVQLSVSPQACHQFGSEDFRTTTNGVFKAIEFVTCGHFYKDNGEKVSSADDREYCGPESFLPVSEKKWAGSLGIHVLSKDLDSLDSLDWMRSDQIVCLNDTHTYPDGRLEFEDASRLNLPTRGVPFEIVLYKGKDCQPEDEPIRYHFYKGLEHSYLNEEPSWRQLNSEVSLQDSVLYLAMNEIKRGTSSFMHLIPSISCGTTSPLSCVPNIDPIAENTVYGPGHARYIFSKSVDETYKCSNLNLLGATPPESITCYQENDHHHQRIVLGFHFDDSCQETNSCVYNFKFGSSGTNQTVTAIYTNNFLPQIFDQLYESFGHQKTNPIELNLFGLNRLVSSLSEAEEDRGKLARVAEMFRPDGPGGLLGELNCSRDMGGVGQTINFYDHGIWKTYQVEVKGLGSEQTDENKVPAFISGNNHSRYEAMMTLRRQRDMVWITESVMKFSCGEKLGQLENQKDEKRYGQGEVKEKEIIFWNTQDLNNARFEQYLSHKTWVDQNDEEIVKRARTEFNRSQTQDGGNKLITQSAQFAAELNEEATYYHQQAERLHIEVDKSSTNKLEARKLGLYLPSSKPFDLFEANAFKKLQEKVSLSEKSALALSPDKTKWLKVYPTNNNTMVLEGLDISQSSPITFSSNSSPHSSPSLSLDVNNQGNGIACWIDSNHKLQVYGFNGTQWSSSNLLGNSITSSQAECKINDSDTIFVLYLTDQSSAPGLYQMTSSLQSPQPTTLPIENNLGLASIPHFHAALDETGYPLVVYTIASSSGQEVKIYPAISGKTQVHTLDLSKPIFDLEISSASLSAPKINIYYTDTQGPKLLQRKFLDNSFEDDKEFSHVGGYLEKNCFEASTNGFLINSVNTETSCPNLNTDLNNNAIHNKFEFNIKSLEPDLIEEVFTSEEIFQTK